MAIEVGPLLKHIVDLQLATHMNDPAGIIGLNGAVTESLQHVTLLLFFIEVDGPATCVFATALLTLL